MARKRSITSCISSSEIKRLKMDRAEEDEDNIEALQSSRSYRPNELGTLGEDDDDKNIVTTQLVGEYADTDILYSEASQDGLFALQDTSIVQHQIRLDSPNPSETSTSNHSFLPRNLLRWFRHLTSDIDARESTGRIADADAINSLYPVVESLQALANEAKRRHHMTHSIMTRLTNLHDKDSLIDFQRQSTSQTLVKLKEGHTASQKILNDWEQEFPKYANDGSESTHLAEYLQPSANDLHKRYTSLKEVVLQNERAMNVARSNLNKLDVELFNIRQQSRRVCDELHRVWVRLEERMSHFTTMKSEVEAKFQTD